MFQTHIPGANGATCVPSEEIDGLGSGRCDVNFLCTYDVLIVEHQPADGGLFQDALCIAISMVSNGNLNLRGQKGRA